MKALCWHGKGDIRCDTVPDPATDDARDVIVKVFAVKNLTAALAK